MKYIYPTHTHEAYTFHCWYNCATKNASGVYVKAYKYSV